MKKKSVLVTGSNGGIGQALCKHFAGAGWGVIATDLHEKPHFPVDQYICLDLACFAVDKKFRRRIELELSDLFSAGLNCLINNGAYQVVAPLNELTAEDWHRSINVNVTAPFFLVKALLESLKLSKGNVINISSVHARLTKPNFGAYATSKAALEGLTRSLGVELGKNVRINAIAPAAIGTSMLEAGFERAPEVFDKLVSCHPSGCLGTPQDIAALALFIADDRNGFLNGSILGIDGGIGSRLHDPL